MTPKRIKDAIVGAVLVTMVMIAECHSARILCLLPFPSKSHRFVFSSIVQELVDRGHHVTVVSAYNQIPPHRNYTEIIYKDEWREVHSKESLYTLKDQGMMGKLVVLWKMGLHTCEKVLQDKEVQGILQSTEIHFDLILIEAFFNECLLGFAHKFRAPTVHICSHGGMFWMGDYVGNPNPHAYVPDVFFDFSDKMTFQQRVWNTLAALFARAGRELWYLPQQNTIMKNYFKYEDLPSVWELQTNTSAVMLNTHVAVNYPRPLMPNLLLVGGMHIKKPGKLPQDLQRYLDDAPGGVIYFSMGTNLQSSLMPESKVKAFLGAFSRLTEQKVLWKWESDSLPGQPNNVKLAKWLPQSDILAHPNIRLFVSHGGMMSTQEAVYRGVPLVGIPIFSDQLLNIRQASAAGYALHLDYENITEESVYWAIQQVLYVPKYRENAQRISRIFRDNPMPPLELAAYWIEYIIRHKGAAHLRSSSLDLYWYQYFLLDVTSVLFLAVVTLLLILYFVSSYFIRRVISAIDIKKKKF